MILSNAFRLDNFSECFYFVVTKVSLVQMRHSNFLLTLTHKCEYNKNSKKERKNHDKWGIEQ